MVPLRVIPYREIAIEIAARLSDARGSADPLEAWPEEVIVPSRGMAEAIAAEMLKRWPRGVAGLRMQTLDELAQRTLASSGQPPRVASAMERRLAMRVAVRGSEHPVMESRGVASMLERAYRDVRDSGMPLSELSRRVSATRGLRTRDRTEAIVRVWGDYERLIAQLHAIDGADRLARATRLAGSVAPQLLAGFYDVTGAQLAFLQGLLRAGRIAGIWVPTDREFAQPFLQAMAPWAASETDSGDTPRAHQPSAMQYESRLDELRDVCARVKALLDAGTSPVAIGIVARSIDPYDARLLQRFAAEQGFRTTLADPIPLPAHRIGRGAITLMRLRERGFLRGEVLELLRDGLRVKARLSIDAVDAETRRARISGGTSEELRRMRRRGPQVDDYIAVVAELEALTATIDPGFLTRLGSLFRIETESDLDAVAALDEIAALFARAAAWNRGFDVNAALDAIEQEVLPNRIQSDPGHRPAIWAGDIMRFRGRSFTHLFVVRMQDDVFPQRRTEDPLLPDADRRLLQLRMIGDGREEESLLFSLLDESSLHVSYSFATGDGFGKVLRQSRFLRGMPIGEVIPPGLPVPSTPTRSRPLQLLVQSGTRSVFDGYIGPLSDALRSKLQAVSPTQLEDFGECPQKFLFKHLLGVNEVDAPEREVQIHHREKGSIDHRILESFYRKTAAAELAGAVPSLPQLPPELAARLDLLIDEQFDAHEAVVPPFNRTVRDIERRATRRILREFLASDLADLDASDLVPQWFEYRFGAKHRRNPEAPPADHPEPFVVDAGGVPVRVEGTIDRIDVERHPSGGPGTGRFRIVDYKSGKALRHVNLGDKIDRGVRLQLALYAMAAAEFFDAPPELVSGTIKPIVIGEKPSRFAFDLHEKRSTLMQTLEIFARAILEGTFPAFPNDNDAEFNSCKYCPVNHSCRTRHDTDERYAVQQQKDPRTLLGGGDAEA